MRQIHSCRASVTFVNDHEFSVTVSQIDRIEITLILAVIRQLSQICTFAEWNDIGIPYRL